MQNDEEKYSSQSPEFLEVYPERKGKILQEDKKTILSKLYNREKIVKSCQTEVLYCFENVPYLKLLWESIENRGCKLDLNRHFSCEICQPGKDVQHAGTYDESTNQVVVCANNATKTSHCCGSLLRYIKFIYSEKATKILRNLPLTFDHSTYSQKSVEDFAKFCGILRIYELY